MTISVEKIRIQSNIGVYPEEKIKKNDFLVDVFVNLNLSKSFEDDEISETLDYQKVYVIVLEEMQKTGNILESKAIKMIQNIKKIDKNVSSIRLKISKLKPNYMEACECAAVEITQHF